MTTTTVSERIQSLRTEAAEAGDLDMVAMCDRAIENDATLHDSDGAGEVGPEELGTDLPGYVSAIVASLDCPEAEGHVRCGSRRVYAA